MKHTLVAILGIIILILAQAFHLFSMIPDVTKSSYYKLVPLDSSPSYLNALRTDKQRLILQGNMWDGTSANFELANVNKSNMTIDYKPIAESPTGKFSVIAYYVDGASQVLFEGGDSFQDEMYSFTIENNEISYIDFRFNDIIRTLKLTKQYSEVYIKN